MQHGQDDARTLEHIKRGEPVLLWRRLIADTETPVSAALKLFRADRGDFLLESVEGGAIRGRHSLIGIDPDLVFRVDGNTASINRDWQTDKAAFAAVPGDAVAALRELVSACHADMPPELPRALACLVGYFGYETMGLIEKLPRPEAPGLGLPDMMFVRPSVLLIFDSLKDELFLVAPIWPEAKGSAEERLARAQDRLAETEASLASAPLPPASRLATLPDVQPRAVMAPGRFPDMVAEAKELIAAGDIFQVVLSQRFEAEFPLPPFDLYRALRRINPSPFLYFLDLPGFALIGSSPEILVRVRDGTVTIRPIAGTRPRGKNEREDAENRVSLLADTKELAEHLMLLDLGRNDVGRVASGGSVKVVEQFTIEQYSHVMHIVSHVEGQLDPAHDAIDAMFAGFPAGTVSGAPKIRACEIITALEGEARGAYAGGVGYFAPDGSVDSCIVLRTAIVRDGMMHVQAGAGIVADSQPDYEQRECEAKAGALFAAAREAVRIAGEPGFGQ